MHISTFGARFFGGQIDRIDEGLRILGHFVNELGPPDIIYANDAEHYDAAIARWLDYDKHPKLILNVLDVPYWIPTWPHIYYTWVSQLNVAHQVTCISETVRKDIYKYFALDAKVIYNPIKPVYRLETAKNILALFVGRCNAPNKRVRELIWPLYSLLKPHFGEHCIHFIGSENPGFGYYHGIVSDEELNKLYNQSFFTLITSSFEGLNLPMIEGIICNSKPLICKDMSTALELGIPELLCDPNPVSLLEKAKEVYINLDKYDKICHPYAIKYSNQFSPQQIAKNILQIYTDLV